jgi:hypothetical protein
MNRRIELESLLKEKNVRKATKHEGFDFEGILFPLKLTKRLLGTFKAHDKLWVNVADDTLFFTWDTGHAHINSIAKAASLSKASK